MQADEVVRLLGEPDDIRTQFDPGGIPTTRTTEIWCYGTSGHLTFPTLGCVFMDADGVQYLYGGKGTPIDPMALDESELRKLLQLIDNLSESRGNNPLLYIQLVNTLQPLGKEKSLAVIDEYLRVAPAYLGDPIPLFILLRLLFEVPEDPGYMPRMMVGRPSVKEPDDRKLIPLFPVVLLDDIPLNLVIGYTLMGMRQPVEEHLEYFRKNGKWRERPLHPSNHPLELLATLERSPQWIYGEGRNGTNNEWEKNQLAEQLLRLVRSVYRIETDYDGRMIQILKDNGSGWHGMGGNQFDVAPIKKIAQKERCGSNDRNGCEAGQLEQSAGYRADSGGRSENTPAYADSGHQYHNNSGWIRQRTADPLIKENRD